MGKNAEEPEKQKVLIYFLLCFPSVIIAAIPSNINGGTMLSLVLRGLLIFFQFVMIKNFVETQYD